MDKKSFQSIVGDLRTVEIKGTTFYLRQMSVAEFFAWMDRITANEKDGNGNMASLLVRTLCTESGERIFEDGDEAEILQKPYPIISKLSTATLELNGMSEVGREEIGKNSESQP